MLTYLTKCNFSLILRFRSQQEKQAAKQNQSVQVGVCLFVCFEKSLKKSLNSIKDKSRLRLKWVRNSEGTPSNRNANKVSIETRILRFV